MELKTLRHFITVMQESYACVIGHAKPVDTSWESGLTFRLLDPPVHTRPAGAWRNKQPLTPAATAFLDELRAVTAA